MTYRVAAGVLAHLLPVVAETNHETLRGRTLKLGEQLRHVAPAMPEPTPTAAASASAITLSLDSTFIRSRHEGERHLEVRVGNAETSGSGGRQVFGAVANADTDIVALTIQAVADRGYYKGEDIQACEDAGIEAYVARPQRGLGGA